MSGIEKNVAIAAANVLQPGHTRYRIMATGRRREVRFASAPHMRHIFRQAYIGNIPALMNVMILLHSVRWQSMCLMAIVFAGISKLRYVEAVSVEQPKLIPLNRIYEKRARRRRSAAEMDEAAIRREIKIRRGQQN
jgi:tRNA(Arg) A34 adenosine deaminase TadA